MSRIMRAPRPEWSWPCPLPTSWNIMPRTSSSGRGTSCITCVRCGSVFGELARPQALELAHADQRVLVDGVDVERVVRDQAVEVPELGDRLLQHAEPVHLEERLVDVPARARGCASSASRDRRRSCALRPRSGSALADQLAGRRARASPRGAAPPRRRATSAAGSRSKTSRPGDRERPALDAHAVADDARGGCLPRYGSDAATQRAIDALR